MAVLNHIGHTFLSVFFSLFGWETVLKRMLEAARARLKLCLSVTNNKRFCIEDGKGNRCSILVSFELRGSPTDQPFVTEQAT